MKAIDLREVVRKIFALRPNNAYTRDEVYGQFQRWHAKALLCTRGDVCIKAGTPANEFAMVVSGLMHVSIPSALGEDFLLRQVKPGEFVGLTHVFAPEELHQHDVVAAKNSEIVIFSVQEVRKWRTDPQSLPLFDHLGSMLSAVCRDAEEKVLIMSGSDIAERLKRYLLLRMAKEGTQRIVIPGTASDLARYLGVNKCAFSRVIGRLRDAGKIEYDKKVITVLSSLS